MRRVRGFGAAGVDFGCYRRIISAIGETHNLAEIDAVIDRHRGWPGAFAEKF